MTAVTEWWPKPCAFLLAAILISTLLAVVTVLHRQGAVNGKPSIVAAVTSFPAAAPVRVALPPSPVGVPPHRGRHPHRPSLDWEALAFCESSGRWHDNTGNGYYGLYQMDLDFWATYGGHRYAPRPDLATRGQQLVVALNGYRARGSQPWPQCGYLLGGSR